MYTLRPKLFQTAFHGLSFAKRAKRQLCWEWHSVYLIYSHCLGSMLVSFNVIYTFSIIFEIVFGYVQIILVVAAQKSSFPSHSRCQGASNVAILSVPGRWAWGPSVVAIIGPRCLLLFYVIFHPLKIKTSRLWVWLNGHSWGLWRLDLCGRWFWRLW